MDAHDIFGVILILNIIFYGLACTKLNNNHPGKYNSFGGDKVLLGYSSTLNLFGYFMALGFLEFKRKGELVGNEINYYLTCFILMWLTVLTLILALVL